MKAPIITSGTWTIRGLHDGRRCFALDYIDSLQESDQKKLHALLQRSSEKGPPRTPEKFGKVEGNIYEFKSFQDRLFCFFYGNKTVILIHGFRKKRNRIHRKEIDRATRLIAQFMESEDV
jgi:phage-related protein